MVGDLIFVDFDKGNEECEPDKAPAKLPLLKTDKAESRSEKIKRLAAQIDSGEYEVDSDKLAEALLGELSDLPDSD